MIDEQLFAIFAGLFFALVAHHLTIGRDRRREFNEIAIPLRRKIRSEAKHPSPARLAITADEADAIAARLWWFERRRFLRYCDEYWHAHGQQHQNQIGEPIHDVPEQITKTLTELLGYIKPR